MAVYAAASVLDQVQFGLPGTAEWQACDAAGFSVAAFFGVPLAPISYTFQEGNRVAHAYSFRPVAFGFPSGWEHVSLGVTGLSQTQYGSINSVQLQLADGISSTGFGVATYQQRAKATGFKATLIGKPAKRILRTASAVSKVARFGRPKAIYDPPIQAYGFRSTRFGLPKGRSTYVFQITGSVTSIVFGLGLSFSTLKAQPTPPKTRFGKQTTVRG